MTRQVCSSENNSAKSHPEATFKTGDVIGGEFEICKIVGAGGFGEVHLAYHHATESFCALKTIRSDKFADDILYEAFKKEALLWVNLEQHPFILAAQGIRQFSGRLFVLMAYVAPDTRGRVSLLDHLIHAHGPLDTDRALTWAIQFCFGMEHAYQRGITCHRDIKPANILITQNGVLKITDFGLAVAADVAWREKSGSLVTANDQGFFGLSLTQAEGRRICGTPGYIAPELYLGEKADRRSDIYSFGLVLWQMLTGSPLPPFHVPHEQNIENYLREVFNQQMKGRVPPVSEPLNSIIARCLTPAPSTRYEDFGDLRGHLERTYLKRTGRLVELPKSQGQTEDFWNNKGNSLLSLDRYEEALACYDKALEINPRDALCWSNKGNALLSLGRPLDAIACSSKALEIDPSHPWAWRTMGNARLEQGRGERSMACARALEIAGIFDWTNMSVTFKSLAKGNAKVAMDQPKQAIVHYENALEINPHDPAAWSGKGNAVHSLGRHEEAVACCDKALEIDSRFALAWNNKANAVNALGRRDEARACRDKAQALDPRCAFAQNSKTAALLALGLLQEAAGPNKSGHALAALADFHKALACYEKAEKIEPPRDLFALTEKAEVLDELGWVEEAFACYQRVLEIDPRYSRGWTYKGDALEAAGRFEEAVACYDKALEINPRDGWVWGQKEPEGPCTPRALRGEEAIACWEKQRALGE